MFDIAIYISSLGYDYLSLNINNIGRYLVKIIELIREDIFYEDIDALDTKDNK